MEIVFEILFAILHFCGELLVQIIFEFFAEVGIHGLREPFRRPKPLHPIFAGICYIAFGFFAGWVSLLVFPSLFISSFSASVVNLVLTPIFAGGVMTLVGTWRRRRGKELIRLDRFAYGFLFALAMAVIRFTFAS